MLNQVIGNLTGSVEFSPREIHSYFDKWQEASCVLLLLSLLLDLCTFMKKMLFAKKLQECVKWETSKLTGRVNTEKINAHKCI